MTNMEIDKITERIIGCAYKVSNTLGIGFVEKVYENSHAYEMRKDGLRVLQQYPVKVIYDEIVVGDFCLDMLVNDTVIVEVKAVSTPHRLGKYQSYKSFINPSLFIIVIAS